MTNLIKNEKARKNEYAKDKMRKTNKTYGNLIYNIIAKKQILQYYYKKEHDKIG